MRIISTYRKQGGFFAAGIALLLTAVFGVTTATIVATAQDPQESAAAAQPQSPAATAVASRQTDGE